jgi:hypothetical protein
MFAILEDRTKGGEVAGAVVRNFHELVSRIGNVTVFAIEKFEDIERSELPDFSAVP